MAKFKTERIVIDGAVKQELDFKIDVFIDAEGLFTATLPESIANLFEKRGIKLSTNGRSNGRAGFYRADTYFKLVESIKFSCKEYVSRELIRESIVIKYVIETTCSYLINEDEEIVPNGGWVNDRTQEGRDWRNGTEFQYAASPHPFGLRIYAKPFYKREYKYRSGTEKIEYNPLYEDNCKDDQPNLKWLAGVCSIKEPSGGKRNEIEYTEKTAFFFVNFYKTICNLNEKLKQFIEPENLLMLIDKQLPLLNNANQ